MIQVRLADLDELWRITPMKEQIHAQHVAGRPDLFAPLENLSAFEAYVREDSLRLFLAERDGEPLGYALTRVVDRPANPYMRRRLFLRVEEICVDERFRRQGVGHALMEAVREDAKALGCPRVVLDVWAFNEEAMRFYQSMGFCAYQTFLEKSTDERS